MSASPTLLRLIPQRERVVVASSVPGAAVVDQIWQASQDADDQVFRPRTGWWSLATWARATKIIMSDGQPIGVAAVGDSTESRTAEVRLALLPPARTAANAARLMCEAFVLAREIGRPRLELVVPSEASWAIAAASRARLRLIGGTDGMLRDRMLPMPVAPAVSPFEIRALRSHEDGEALAALNRAWAGSIRFRTITASALTADLQGQRDGFLVAVDLDGAIVGTTHAVFDPAASNLDGQPFAWLSNVTVDPALRGRGIAKALLAAGLRHLNRQGATSVMLGVDASNGAAISLYRHAGFRHVGGIEIWKGGGP